MYTIFEEFQQPYRDAVIAHTKRIEKFYIANIAVLVKDLPHEQFPFARRGDEWPVVLTTEDSSTPIGMSWTLNGEEKGGSSSSFQVGYLFGADLSSRFATSDDISQRETQLKEKPFYVGLYGGNAMDFPSFKTLDEALLLLDSRLSSGELDWYYRKGKCEDITVQIPFSRK